MAFGAYSKFLFCAVVAALIYHISAAPAIDKRSLQTVRLLSDEAGLFIAVSSTYSVYAESDENGEYMHAIVYSHIWHAVMHKLEAIIQCVYSICILARKCAGVFINVHFLSP